MDILDAILISLVKEFIMTLLQYHIDIKKQN